MRGLTVLLVVAVAIGLAGCGNKSKAPMLMNAKANTPTVGPDPFGLVPNRPLQDPPDMKSLPTPTPGSANLADARPEADAVEALGGKSRAVAVPANSALMAAVGRYGIDPTIRQELAQADIAYRRTHRGRIFERLLKGNTYYAAYADESLDPWAELRWLAQRGIAIPTAPPKP